MATLLALLVLAFIELQADAQFGTFPQGPVYYCTSFTQRCGLFNYSRSSGYKWSVIHEPVTSTIDTGPDENTPNPTEVPYVYADASAGSPSDTTSLLFGYETTGSDRDYCLAFKYHMNGRHVGRLTVFKRISLNEPEFIASRTGSQGNRWHPVYENISVPSNSLLEVLFTATRGSGSMGDIALDDLYLYPGPCQVWSEWSVCSAACQRTRRRLCRSDSCPGKTIMEDCPGSNCREKDCIAADICFVVDSSGSIKDKGEGNWDVVLSYIQSIVSALSFGSSCSKVSVIQFGDNASVYFDFTQYTDRQRIISEVGNMPYLSGGTNTQAALKLTREVMFTSSRGDRSGYRNVAVVLTDGESTVKPGRTIPEATLAKSQNISIITIGVTNSTNATELRGMASDKKYIMKAKDFQDLLTQLMKENLVSALEDAVNQKKWRWKPWSAWSRCSTTCSLGWQNRRRSCDYTCVSWWKCLCRGTSFQSKSCLLRWCP